MSKVITPMKRLKGQLDNLKLNLENDYEFDSKEKRSEKIHYKTDFWGDKKEPITISEIVSDHIIFFNSIPRNDQGGVPYKNYSFSISFDFMDKELEEQSIQLSYLNEDDKIIHSKPFTVEDFKEHIKNINKHLKDTNNLQRDFIFNQIKEIIINNPYDINQDVIKAETEIESLLNEKKEKIGINEAEQVAKQNNSRFEKVSDIIASIIENSEEYLELKKIEERAKELKQKISENTTSLKTSYNFSELKEAKIKSDLILELKQKEIEHEKNKALSKQTSAVRKRVQQKFN